MAKRARHVISGLALTVIAFTAADALAAEDETATIVLHVENHAELLPAVRSSAEAVVTRVYATARVRTVWANGHEHTDMPGLHVRVTLVSRDTTIAQTLREAVPESVLGVAWRDARRVHIFLDRIARVALRQDGDFKRMLGWVIAHEVGHLVLPVYSHSDRGIMHASLHGRSKTVGGFTTEQTVAIRSMLQRPD